MPTYTSARSSNVRVKGPDKYYTIVPGENELGFYLQTLPTSVTLTDHTPQVNPYVRVADVSSFPSTDYEVYGYETIIITNKTDAVCALYANDDDGETIEVTAGATLTIDNTKREWGLLTVHSAGSGTVSVWGCVDA